MPGFFQLIENYVYIHQLGVFVILPTYPETITDALGSTFAEENILSRTAPLYSYSYSGPRTVRFSFTLHRDLMSSINAFNTNFIDEVGEMLKEDYIDTLIRYLQAMALPAYSNADSASSVYNSMVKPPMISVRIGNQLFIKGIVRGEVTVQYSGPIAQDGKYNVATVDFSVSEVEPQDAEQLTKYGSFRNMGAVFTNGLYKK